MLETALEWRLRGFGAFLIIGSGVAFHKARETALIEHVLGAISGTPEDPLVGCAPLFNHHRRQHAALPTLTLIFHMPLRPEVLLEQGGEAHAFGVEGVDIEPVFRGFVFVALYPEVEGIAEGFR